MLIGYARVSTLDQNPELQIEALNEVGCKKIFTEKISGADKKRKQLQEALDYMREGDTLVIWVCCMLSYCIISKKKKAFYFKNICLFKPDFWIFS